MESKKKENSSAVNVNGQTIAAQWSPLHFSQPIFFWDDETKTLGLDGDWREGINIESINIRNVINHPEDRFTLIRNKIQHLYLGDNFMKSIEVDSFLASIPTTVSPKNKDYKSVNGILMNKEVDEEGWPELPWCGKGLYELKRNGKCSIVDSHLKPITPSIYDYVGNFDHNGLCLVKIGDRCGMVNKRGEEQIPLIYDQIKENGCLYEVRQDGEEFSIDIYGNRQ
jgi:hypothetical protein